MSSEGSHSPFEMSYGGDNSRIKDTTRLECKICWRIYDPAVGCDYWQIQPNTPFSQLPEHWSCPECEGVKEQFMVLSD